MNPATTFVSRRELIEDAAFAELETDGKLPADRTEAVLSAIYYVLTLFAASQGVNVNDVEIIAGDVRATRPRFYSDDDLKRRAEALEKREVERTRRDFAPRLARVKAALARQEKALKSQKKEV